MGQRVAQGYLPSGSSGTVVFPKDLAEAVFSDGFRYHRLSSVLTPSLAVRRLRLFQRGAEEAAGAVAALAGVVVDPSAGGAMEAESAVAVGLDGEFVLVGEVVAAGA